MADLQSLQDLAPQSSEPAAPVYVQKLDAKGRAYATGKRKNAVARVWVSRGGGRIIINGKDFTAYFARPVLQMVVQQPIIAAIRTGQYDINATVSGGGLSGQAGAVRHGISRALTYYEPELAHRAEEGRVPHPRLPRRRAKEVRPRQGPPLLPVLQALTRKRRNCNKGRAAGPALFRLDTRDDTGCRHDDKTDDRRAIDRQRLPGRAEGRRHGADLRRRAVVHAAALHARPCRRRRGGVGHALRPGDDQPAGRALRAAGDPARLGDLRRRPAIPVRHRPVRDAGRRSTTATRRSTTAGRWTSPARSRRRRRRSSPAARSSSRSAATTSSPTRC